MEHYKYEVDTLKITEKIVMQRHKLSRICLDAVVTGNVEFAEGLNNSIILLDKAIDKLERACGIDGDLRDVCDRRVF